MAKIPANELRPGMLIEYNGALWRVAAASHVKVSGRGGAGIQAELRALEGSSKLSNRFRTDEKLERPFVAQRSMQFLYADGGSYVFMDTTSFEQVEVAAEVLAGVTGYLTAELKLQLLDMDGRIIGVELPAAVELRVVETEPHIKGATATGGYKPAVTETGITVMVPPFIKKDEVVKVATATGEYLERAG